MALTLKITPEVEQRLRQAAQAVGLSPDIYALQLIDRSLGSNAFDASRLSKKESDLIETINHSHSGIDWPSYNVLIAKRGNETLSDKEYDTLLAFTEQLDQANLIRMEAIASLAQLRNISADDVINSLDLETKHYI